MTHWVSLKAGWTLQDVQAGLNVVIAFLCAGGIFVLVRYCWLIAARRVAHAKDVHAYQLLSLNTIGETIDVIWLLRYELFARRYHGLLVQVVSVMVLTVAALTSGFIARFSTRYGVVLKDIDANGTIAQRNTQSLPYAEVETNLTLFNLQRARFPQTQLLEYMPDQSKHWVYDPAQWNGSWTMDCQYNKSTPISDPVASNDCTNGLWTQIPWLNDNWSGWDNNQSYYSYDYTGWRNNETVYRDFLIFTHGLKYTQADAQIQSGMRVQTVAVHLQGVNATTPQGCSFGSGRFTAASYTSMSCKLTRNLTARSNNDLSDWGAAPDFFDVDTQAGAYTQHYANRFRQESSRDAKITIIEGEELAMFYQAYLITKDTSTAPFVLRTISTYVRVPQISLPCLVGCSAAAGIVLFGLFNYWLFLFRHWSRLDKTPQSKLDWMLHTLRKQNEDHTTSRPDMRKRLSSAMASGASTGEAVPLTYVTVDQNDRKSIRSTVSSTFTAMPTPELQHRDDGFETSTLGANFSGRSPTATWFPQQYERVSPYVRPGSWSMGGRNRDYNPVQQQSPYMWQGMNVGTHHVDTAYDPGRG